MSAASGSPASSGVIRGGDAWIVPFEPGGPVWVTASAPAIRVMDRRAPRTAAAPVTTASQPVAALTR